MYVTVNNLEYVTTQLGIVETNVTHLLISSIYEKKKKYSRDYFCFRNS